MLRSIFLLLALTLFGATSLQAKTYSPYLRPGIQAPDYNDQIPILYSGDELLFSNGEKYRVDGLLGHGNLTLVIRATRVSSGQKVALRMPLFSGIFPFNDISAQAFEERQKALKDPLTKNSSLLIEIQNRQFSNPSSGSATYQDLMNASTSTFTSLSSTDFPMVDVIDANSREYVATEIIEPPPGGKTPLTLESLIIKPESLSSEEMSIALKSLGRFAEQLTPVDRLHDFRSDQVLYDFQEKKWKIADLTWTPKYSSGIFKSSQLEDRILLVALNRTREDLLENHYSTTFIDQLIPMVRAVQQNQLQSLKAKKHHCSVFDKIFR